MSPPLRRVRVVGRPSPRVLRACAAFGLVVSRGGDAPVPDGHVLRAARRWLRAGALVLLTGPSGCGKSTLLREIVRRTRAGGARVVVAPRPRPDRAIIDAFPGGSARAMGGLARAGLGEPTLWVRRAAELSEGEWARLVLALALARASRRTRRRGVLLAIDEWGANLDRASALAGARALRRAARRGGDLGIVCASPREDIADLLRADLTLRGSLGGGGWTMSSTSEKGRSATTAPWRGSTTAPARRPRPCG